MHDPFLSILNQTRLTLKALSTTRTIVVFNVFFVGGNSLLLRTKYVCDQDLQLFGLNLNKFEYFYPLGVVGRGSETQLQMGENLNKARGKG